MASFFDINRHILQQCSSNFCPHSPQPLCKHAVTLHVVHVQSAWRLYFSQSHPRGGHYKRKPPNLHGPAGTTQLCMMLPHICLVVVSNPPQRFQ
jgi:hypothetical protein